MMKVNYKLACERAFGETIRDEDLVLYDISKLSKSDLEKLQIEINTQLSQDNIVDWNQYQKDVTVIKKYPKGNKRAFAYLMAKLAEESGEVAKEVRKCYDKGKEIDREELKLELGDVLWCIAALGEQKGITLQEIMEANLVKLQERKLLK